MGENRCVCCGEIIPEGQQACEFCKSKAHQETTKEKNERIVDDWIGPMFLIVSIAAIVACGLWVLSMIVRL